MLDMNRIKNSIYTTFREPVTRYISTITFIIAILLVFQILYDGTIGRNPNNMGFLSDADKQLVTNFIEWFGVLYGFLLPTILVRVWEQFDEIDNVFDREADAIQILERDLLLLQPQHKDFTLSVLELLHDYTKNVLRFTNDEITQKEEEDSGNKILTSIRKKYMHMFERTSKQKKESDILVGELLTQLNSLIDYRGDRISLSTQRLFESLNLLAIITSAVWLVPFYFLHFQDTLGHTLKFGIFGWILVIAVTFLVIMILTVIDDLDRPFDGIWKVNIDAWVSLEKEICEEKVDFQLKYFALSSGDALETLAPPQSKPSVKNEQETTVAISMITAIPNTDINHQGIPDTMKPKSARKNSRGKKRSSSASSGQPQVNLTGNEDGEKSMPFE